MKKTAPGKTITDLKDLAWEADKAMISDIQVLFSFQLISISLCSPFHPLAYYFQIFISLMGTPFAAIRRFRIFLPSTALKKGRMITKDGNS